MDGAFFKTQQIKM